MGQSKSQPFLNSIFPQREDQRTSLPKRIKATSASGHVGDGAAAWEALADRRDGNTKESRRACRTKLLSAVMKSEEDRSDFPVMDGLTSQPQGHGGRSPS